MSQVLQREHPFFPSALRDIATWPTQLHCDGALRWEGPAIALVGARAASGRGMERARELAADFVSMGYRIISGGALGIDSAAHRGALEARGYTMAVMACGLDCYYPRRNQPLFEGILRGGGAIVSPYEMGRRPLPGQFVRRNQVIAALSTLVVVVEASTNSGSLHTARFALGLGRKLAALSGSPGCETLLANGIPLLREAGDAGGIIDGSLGHSAIAIPEVGSLEGRVLETLSATAALSAIELGELLGQPLRLVSRSLLSLQLSLLALALPGQRYLRSPLAQRALAKSSSEGQQ